MTIYDVIMHTFFCFYISLFVFNGTMNSVDDLWVLLLVF